MTTDAVTPNASGNVDVHQEENTQFWLRVRRRSMRRWQRIAAESGRNALIGAAVLGWALLELTSTSHGLPTVTAAPLSGANVIAFATGLAAFISAVWVAVAVQGGTTTEAAGSSALESALVRLNVLSVSARVLSVGVTVLAGAALAWYSGLPKHLDLVRIVAIIGGWALLLTIAADAIAFTTDSESGGLARFRKVDPLLRTRRLLQDLGVDPSTATAKGTARTLLQPRRLLPMLAALVVTPAVATAVGAALNPPDTTQLIGRFVAAALFSAAAFAGWVLLSYLIADHQMVEAGVVAVLVSLFLLILIADIAAAVLRHTPPPTSTLLARVTLSVLLISVPPLFIHGVGAIPSRAPHATTPRRPAVITVVIALLLRRYRRQLAAVDATPGRRWDRLAIIALVLLPLPPVALLMANAARAKLRADPGLRGRGLATTVRWVAAALLAAPLVALILLAFLPVPGWT